MLTKLIQEKMNENKMSLRGAAKKIGIGHTTLMRVLEEGSCNQNTLTKIAKWMNVSPSTLIDTKGIEADSLVAGIASAFSEEPELARVFGEAMQQVVEGKRTPQLLRELAAYYAFRINYMDE